MAYTLQEMKSQYPSSFAGLSDADAIYKIAELTGEDPKLLAEEYGVIAAGQGDFQFNRFYASWPLRPYFLGCWFKP